MGAKKKKKLNKKIVKKTAREKKIKKEDQSDVEEMQQIFESLQGTRIKNILDKAKEEPEALSKIKEKLRIEDFKQFKRKIVSLIIPGKEKEWERIHNDVTIQIEQETDVIRQDGLLIIIKYREKREVIEIKNKKKGNKK